MKRRTSEWSGSSDHPAFRWRGQNKVRACASLPMSMSPGTPRSVNCSSRESLSSIAHSPRRLNNLFCISLAAALVVSQAQDVLRLDPTQQQTRHPVGQNPCFARPCVGSQARSRRRGAQPAPAVRLHHCAGSCQVLGTSFSSSVPFAESRQMIIVTDIRILVQHPTRRKPLFRL